MDKKKLNSSLIQIAKKDFLTFCQLMPGESPYVVAPIHEIMSEKLTKTFEKIKNKEKVRIILSIPPRFGKSWTASCLFPAWALGKDPNMRFILATYGAELSERNGMKTRDLINSDQYRAIFPNIRLRSDMKSKRKWMIEKRNPETDRWTSAGTFTGVGMGGSVTGIGADCIILDDPHKDRAEAESKVQRDRAWEYFKSTLYSRLEGSGAMIVIMQRWHDDDLVGRLLREQEENPDGDQWEIVNFPAIANEDEYYGGELMRKKGESLWPEKFSLETLANIRENIGSYNWFSQFQQNPIIQEDGFFNQNMFQYYTEEDLRDKRLTFYTMIDPAVSLDKNADEAVVTTIAKDKDGPSIYRIEETAGHMKPIDLISTIFEHYKKYNPKYVILESIALQKTFKYALEEEQRRREIYFSIKPVKKTNKEERIKGLIPLYEAGVVYHRKKKDADYEEQLLQFPRGRRDDRIDAMSMVLEYIKKTSFGEVKRHLIPKIVGYYQN